VTDEAATVQRYLEAMQTTFGFSRGGLGTSKGKPTPEMQKHGGVAWRALRDARVYHVDPSMYGEIYEACDRYTTEEIAGLNYEKQPLPNERSGVDSRNERYSPEEVAHHVEAVRAASKRAPWPEWLPFDAMFFGYGKGIPLQQHQLASKLSGSPMVNDVVQGWLTGHLVTAEGHVWEFLSALTMDNYRASLLNLTQGAPHDAPLVYSFLPFRQPDTGWNHTFELTPWVVPTLIQVFKDQMQVIEETEIPKPFRRQMRRKRKRFGMKGGFVPPPFYILNVETSVIRERARGSLYPSPVYVRSYRTDVEAHDRCYIRRGPLPIDGDKLATLHDRGYQVFTTTDVDPVTQAKLVRRQKPLKKPGEWLAIKTIKIEQHMSPSDDSLPYVPALRRLPKRARRSVKPDGCEPKLMSGRPQGTHPMYQETYERRVCVPENSEDPA